MGNEQAGGMANVFLFYSFFCGPTKKHCTGCCHDDNEMIAVMMMMMSEKLYKASKKTDIKEEFRLITLEEIFSHSLFFYPR